MTHEKYSEEIRWLCSNMKEWVRKAGRGNANIFHFNDLQLEGEGIAARCEKFFSEELWDKLYGSLPADDKRKSEVALEVMKGRNYQLNVFLPIYKQVSTILTNLEQLMKTVQEKKNQYV